MKPPTFKPKYFFILAVVLLVVASVMGLSPLRRTLRRIQGPERGRVTDTLPPVISKVRNIEVVNATIKRQGDPSAVAAIELRNNSDRDIVAISIETGEGSDSSGVSTDGFINSDGPPAVILKPHGTITMEMPLSDLVPGRPIKVAAVMYTDETDEGEELAIKSIRSHRDHARANGTPRQGGSAQP